MNINEYAVKNGVHPSTVRRHIDRGIIEAEKVNGAWDIKENKKPAVSKEVTIPSWDVYQNHPIKGITPAHALQYMLESEQGYLENLADLFDDMEERDTRLRHLIRTRKALVLKYNWDVLPFPEEAENPKAQKQCDFIKEKLNQLSETQLTGADAAAYLSFDDLLDYWLDAVPRPFSTAFIKWSTKGKWFPIAAKRLHMRHFRIGLPGSDYNPYELRIKTEENTALGEIPPPYSYVTHYSGDSGFLTRRGLLRAALWYYLFKYHGTKWFLRYAEIAAVPFRVATYDDNTDNWKETLQRILVGLRNMGDQGFAALPASSTFEFKDAGRSSASSNPPQQLVDFCNAELTQLFLGQGGTTTSTPGKLGDMAEQENVQDAIAARDAKQLMSTVNRHLIAPMARFNFGEPLCYFWIDYEPGENVKEQMEIVTMAAKLISIPESHIKEIAGIPNTEPGEPETTPDSGGSGLFPFSRRVRNARQERQNRDARVRKDVYAIEDSAIDASLPLYDALFRGVNEKNYENKLIENKAKFIDGFKKVCETQLNKLPSIFNKYYKDKKNNALDVSWDLAEQGAVDFMNWQAFTFSTLEGELVTSAMIQSIKDGISKGLAEGTTFNEFLKGIRESYGIDSVKRHHLQNAWRTNLSTAHSANVYDRMNKGDYPAWEFIGIDDANQTDICNDRNGNIYPASNTADFPPLHFQCRSEASPIDSTELEEQGYELSDAPGATPPDKGFKNLAVTNYNNWVEKQAAGLPKSVQQDLKKELDTIKTASKEVTDKEKDAVRWYTGSTDYKTVNKQLRSGKPLSRASQAKINDISSALSKSEKHSGTVYRGMAIEDPKVAQRMLSELQPGNTTTLQGLTSTTVDKKIAQGYARRFGEPIVMEMKGKTGVDISKFSSFQKEKEVLFDANTRWKVTGVKKPTRTRPFTTIIMEQI